MYNTLSSFYNSKQWHDVRMQLINERADNDGVVHCAECGKPIVNRHDLIAHHVKPLTMQNVNDFAVSLNPENILLVHAACHNEIHNRFGYCTQRKVYYVYGAPCSGKTSFVNSVKGNSDLVVDMDNVWQAITGGQRYEKPNALKTNAFGVLECLTDMVKTRAGKWERAYVIEGGAVKGIRERKIESLGAEPIFIDTSKEECLKRLLNDPERTPEQKKEWQKHIERWFNDYTE